MFLSMFLSLTLSYSAWPWVGCFFQGGGQWLRIPGHGDPSLRLFFGRQKGTHTHFLLLGARSAVVYSVTKVMTLAKPALSAACLVFSGHEADCKFGSQCTCPLIQPEVLRAGPMSV